MIRMMQVLVAQYGDRQKLYLSWDAASWHVSKKLFERLDEHNFIVGCKGPTVETAPLPARAQFLNVIESIFSGMSRAVIQNSDYKSVDDAKAAIDLRGFVKAASFDKVDCVPHHAVLIAPGLRLGSPKNGNISYVGWRL
jgi:hypothetical protein